MDIYSVEIEVFSQKGLLESLNGIKPIIDYLEKEKKTQF